MTLALDDTSLCCIIVVDFREGLQYFFEQLLISSIFEVKIIFKNIFFCKKFKANVVFCISV